MLKLFSFVKHRRKLRTHEKVRNDHDHCYVEMPNEPWRKAIKSSVSDLCWLGVFAWKMHSCLNNPEKSYTEKKAKHTPSGYSLFTNCLFDATKNKLDCYRGKDCMKKLRQHAVRIVNYEKNGTANWWRKYEKQKVCYKCKKEFNNDDDDDDDDDGDDDDNDNKQYHKVRDHCHYTGKFRGAAHSICNLRYKTPKKISLVFHNGSSYDYHFIINQLAKEFKGQIKWLGENIEKYITFSVPIKKDLIMVKQLGTNQSLLVALDSCRPLYQVLLIIYLKNVIVIRVKIVNLYLTICQSKTMN